MAPSLSRTTTRYSRSVVDESEPVDEVVFRSYRGRRNASVYRNHAIPIDVLAWILDTGEEHAAVVLPTLELYGSRELSKGEAKVLASELRVIEGAAHAGDMGRHARALAEVVEWCANAPEASWLIVAGQ
jgi:hypothetical protein